MRMPQLPQCPSHLGQAIGIASPAFGVSQKWRPRSGLQRQGAHLLLLRLAICSASSPAVRAHREPGQPVRFQNLTLQIEAVNWRGTLAGCSVTAHQHLDGTLSLRYGPHCLRRYDAAATPLPAQTSTERSRGRGKMPPSPATPFPYTTRPNRRGHNFETGHFICYKNRTISFAMNARNSFDRFAAISRICWPAG
jgi:hypothetical protein